MEPTIVLEFSGLQGAAMQGRLRAIQQTIARRQPLRYEDAVALLKAAYNSKSTEQVTLTAKITS